MVEQLTVIALVAWVLAAASLDVRTRRIPNVLTGTGLAAALLLRSAAGWETVAAGLVGGAAAMAIALLLFSLGAFGGGDGKMLIMVGAFLGIERLLPALAITALAGGGLALVAVVRERAVRSTLLNIHAMALRLSRLGRSDDPGALTIPYGIAIGVGAVAALFV